MILPRVFPTAGGAGPSSVSLPSAVNPDIQMPYSMQYSLTIEHSRWDTGFRASYIGTNTRQGDYGFNYNSPVPDGRLYINKPRPFPQYPAINYFTNGAGHQFNGLTLEVERRLAHGLQFQSSWVWARDIGDMERGQLLENPYDRERERSVAPDIPTHRFTTNWIYQLPFGKGTPVPQLSSPGGERYRRRMGYQRDLQLLFGAVSHRLLDRTGPDRHGVYDQRNPPES